MSEIKNLIKMANRLSEKYALEKSSQWYNPSTWFGGSQQGQQGQKSQQSQQTQKAQVPGWFTTFKSNNKKFYTEGDKFVGIGFQKFRGDFSSAKTFATSGARNEIVRGIATMYGNSSNKVEMNLDGSEVEEVYLNPADNMIYVKVTAPIAQNTPKKQ